MPWPAAAGFMALAFAMVYHFGPDLKEQPWYWITPGSVAGVLMWLAASFQFPNLPAFFNSYSNSYGSLGAVIILLPWFYITGFAFLIGGALNSQIEQAAARRGHPEAKEKAQRAA